jgi:hypothetical protein
MVKNKNVERTSEYEVYICNTDHLKILNNNGLLNEDRYFTLEKIEKYFPNFLCMGKKIFSNKQKSLGRGEKIFPRPVICRRGECGSVQFLDRNLYAKHRVGLVMREV